MRIIILLIVVLLMGGCASTLPQDYLDFIARVEFEEMHRTSPYSEIIITTNADDSKDIMYSYKLGPAYNATNIIKGLKLNPQD